MSLLYAVEAWVLAILGWAWLTLRVLIPRRPLAEELCVSTDLLYRWKRGTQVGSEGTRAVGERPEADDLRELRRENAQLRMENDILKKAAIILGTKNPHSSAK